MPVGTSFYLLLPSIVVCDYLCLTHQPTSRDRSEMILYLRTILENSRNVHLRSLWKSLASGLTGITLARHRMPCAVDRTNGKLVPSLLPDSSQWTASLGTDNARVPWMQVTLMWNCWRPVYRSFTASVTIFPQVTTCHSSIYGRVGAATVIWIRQNQRVAVSGMAELNYTF